MCLPSSQAGRLHEPPRLRLPGDGGGHCHPANATSRPLTLARPAASGKNSAEHAFRKRLTDCSVPGSVRQALVATFNQEHASSDGGAVLLKAAERVYGLVKAFAPVSGRQTRTGEDSAHARGPDRPAGLRQSRAVIPMATMPTTWPTTPSTSCCSGGLPGVGAPLASQPTISRFENGARRTVLYRMGRELAACVIERHRRRLHIRAGSRSICDPTDDRRTGPSSHVLQRALWRLVLSADAGFLSVHDREADQ